MALTAEPEGEIVNDSMENRPSRWSAERTTWWVVFGTLALGIVLMLGLWN